ncbi:MAG TPA: ABC transporter permease [Kribbella sp.]|uniref:ABC transporter permease n=1 Tax=Kribbella sp. TaxID=1871183 RepID=UPI002D76CC28|nr:ABC transporter permease [Kribbella sp.]HET6293531.1 ABC transporter permease [Kribbella sp.]
MSTPLRSTYPVPVEDLIPAARTLVDKTGGIPSQNQMMKHFRIGKEKAKAVRLALIEEDAATTATHLHTVPDPADTEPETVAESTGDEMPPAVEEEASPQVTAAVEPGIVAVLPQSEEVPTASPQDAPPVRSWPVLLLALPAFVAVWSGWVGLGTLTGFGVVHPLPGIADGFTINSAITLPIGVETYAAFALRVWLSGQVPASARRFAKWSALSALVLGALGQVAYHLLEAAGVTRAPWQITTVVACLPVAVLGMGAALAHLIHARPSEGN